MLLEVVLAQGSASATRMTWLISPGVMKLDSAQAQGLAKNPTRQQGRSASQSECSNLDRLVFVLLRDIPLVTWLAF